MLFAWVKTLDGFLPRTHTDFVSNPGVNKTQNNVFITHNDNKRF